MAKNKNPRIGKNLKIVKHPVVTYSIDPSAALEIQRHVTDENHAELMVETQRMIDAGADVQDICWHLRSDRWLADRRQDVIEWAEGVGKRPRLADIIRSFPPRRPGWIIVFTIGDGGNVYCMWFKWSGGKTYPSVN